MYRYAASIALLVSFVTVLSACKSTSYSDPEYLAERIRVGDDRAFREVGRLASPEIQVALIPALVDAYNSDLRQEDVVRTLVDIGHIDGLEVFVAALEAADDRQAGLAARGIALVGAEDHVVTIANRLSRVRAPENFEPFLAAMRDLPGQPGVAGPIAEILMRPAGRLGSIATVRMGCTILGQSGATDNSTVDALVFGLVNFIPQGNQDASRECMRALIQVGDPAVPRLTQTFLGQNATVNDHVVQLGLTVEVAQLRAGKTLADLASPAALEVMLGWLGETHNVSTAELQAMNDDQRFAWFRNFGQTFQFAVEYLGNVATLEEGDIAHAALQSLLSPGEGMMLENFHDFMGTSDQAELGLRAAVIKALAQLGDPADRDRIFLVATTGTLGRAPDIFLRKEGAHAFALLSQAGDMVRFDELMNSITNDALREEVENYRVMVQLAENCPEHVLSCLAPSLDAATRWEREKAAHDLAHYADEGVAAAGLLLSHMDSDNLDTRLDYLRGLRRLPLPITADELIDAALEASTSPVYVDVRHELRVLRLLKVH